MRNSAPMAAIHHSTSWRSSGSSLSPAEDRDVTQLLMVVEVLVTQRDPVDSLHDHLFN